MSQSKIKPLAFLAVVALAAVLISAVVSVDVDAARGAGKGGGKGKPGGGTPSTATCSVTPNPVPLYDWITISGSGFAPNTSYGYSMNGWLGFVATDATGSFSTFAQAPMRGTVTVTVSGSGVTATCAFQVF